MLWARATRSTRRSPICRSLRESERAGSRGPAQGRAHRPPESHQGEVGAEPTVTDPGSSGCLGPRAYGRPSPLRQGEPRWTPQNRPYVDTAKPAIRVGAQGRMCCSAFLPGEQAGRRARWSLERWPRRRETAVIVGRAGRFGGYQDSAPFEIVAPAPNAALRFTGACLMRRVGRPAAASASFGAHRSGRARGGADDRATP